MLCWWSLRTEIIAGSSELIEASLLVIVVFVLFCLVLLNEAVRQRWPAAALTREELILVYLMQTVSVGLAGLGQIQFLNQALAGAFYYATPGNGWAQFHPYIPRWWVPDPAVLPAYYRGNSTFFTAEHLRAWAVPIVAWSSFILLLLFGFLCLNVMLRRHWVERERLTFPLVALPLELTRAGASRALIVHREFWLAFFLVCAWRSMTGLHHTVPGFPEFLPFSDDAGQLIDLGSLFTGRPWNGIGYFVLSFHPLIIGITYFLPLDISFSAWFFYLLVKAENVWATALGFRDPGASPAAALVPYTGEQGAGAFLAIALFAFWGARRHLRDVFGKALGRAPKVQDDDEVLSYRTAVFGLFFSFAGVVLFVTLGGMAWWLAALFFLLYLLMIVTCTRLRAEAGPMLGYGPDLNPHRIMVLLPGSQSWGLRDLTVFSYLHWFDSDYRTVAMPQQMEALKMADAAGGSLRASPRRLGLWIMLATALAAVSAFVAVLAIYYHYGAETPRGDNSWRNYNGRLPFVTLMHWVNTPTGPDEARLLWLCGGFAVTTGLTLARAHWLWWPLHPAGFAMAHAGMTMPWVWFATFLGWMAKALLLRYGGMRLFRRAIPFFMGLLLGDIVICVLWSFLGVILDMQVYMFFPG